MKYSIIYLSLFVTLSSLYNPVKAQSGSGYHVAKTFHIASSGGWDYPAIHQGTNELYVSHGTQVNILDKTTGDSLGIIPNTTGVHGIAFVDRLGKGYTSNGRLNSVTVFDLKSRKVLRQIATGKNPDWIFYEEFSEKIITSNHSGGDLTVIDPDKDTIVATIPIGGALETIMSDDAGMLFVNVEDKNEIAAVDIRKNVVAGHWSLAPGEGPTGLAIDVKTKRLFSTCDNLLVVMDATNGKIINKLPIGEGCDGAAFDPSAKLIFTANGEGTLTVIREISSNKFKVIGTVPTKRGARTIALDAETHKLYLPTADYEALPANASKGTRPRMIPGSFQVLVMEK